MILFDILAQKDHINDCNSLYMFSFFGRRFNSAHLHHFFFRLVILTIRNIHSKRY